MKRIIIIFLLAISSGAMAQRFEVKSTEISKDGFNWIEANGNILIKSVSYLKGGDLEYEWANGKIFTLPAENFELRQLANGYILISFSPTGDYSTSKIDLTDEGSGVVSGKGYITDSSGIKRYYKLDFMP